MIICLGFYLLAECANPLTKLEKRHVSLSLTLLIIQYNVVLGAFIGKAPRVKSTLRVFIGGWLAMAITFGLTNLIDHYSQLSWIIYMLISLSSIIDSYPRLGVARSSCTWAFLYLLPNYRQLSLSYSLGTQYKLLPKEKEKWLLGGIIVLQY